MPLQSNMLGGVHSGEQRAYREKKSNTRGLVDKVRNGEGHKTCKDKVNSPHESCKGWASEAAPLLKALAAKLGDPSSNPRACTWVTRVQTPGPAQWKGSTYSSGLFSDLHLHEPPRYIQRNRKFKNVKENLRQRGLGTR